MDKQEIIDSVVTKLKDAGYTPSSVSKADECDVKVVFTDVRPPYTKMTVVVTGEEIDRYARSEPLAKAGAKMELVVRNHVRHAINRLADIRPKELAAERRRVAEGR